MQFTEIPKGVRPPTPFVWVTSVTRIITVAEPGQAHVRRRAAALSKLLGHAEAASREAHSQLSIVVNLEEALSGLTGYLTWPVDLGQVVAGEVPVVVLPGQVGPVANLYRRSLASLKLRTCSQSPDDVVTFALDGTDTGLKARAVGTCPLVGDPPGPATAAEAGERGAATMDVDWTDGDLLGFPTGRLHFDLTPDDMARLWRAWSIPIVGRLMRRNFSQPGGGPDE